MTEGAVGDARRAGDVLNARGAAPARTGSGADPLGLVVGTVPATPLQFSVGLAPGQYVQLDDVVVTRRELRGQSGVKIAGVVTNVEAVHEGARFASDVFLIEQGAPCQRRCARSPRRPSPGSSPNCMRPVSARIMPRALYYSRCFPVCDRAAAQRCSWFGRSGYMLSPPSGRRWSGGDDGQAGGVVVPAGAGLVPPAPY